MGSHAHVSFTGWVFQPLKSLWIACLEASEHCSVQTSFSIASCHLQEHMFRRGSSPHVAVGGRELSGACTAESCGSCLSSFLVPVHKSRCMEVCKALARWGPVRDQTARMCPS